MKSIIITTIISFTMAVLIVIVNKLFKTRISHKKEEILELLPGFNCGACGFGSCEGMADVLMTNPKELYKCKPMKQENKEKLEKLLQD